MSSRITRVLLHIFALLAVIFVPVVLDLGPRVSAQVPAAADPPKYVLPPKAIVDAFDAEPLPQTLLSPNKQVVALAKARTYPTIAELAQPMYRLAGSRVNPKTNGPHRASGLPGTGIYSITLKKIVRRQRNAGQDAAAGAHLAREVLAGRLAPRLPPDKRRCDRAVGRRRHDRRGEGRRQRGGSDQRDDRRSVRLAEGQRHDGVRARALGPRTGAGGTAGALRTARRGELRQGGAGADVRRSAEDGCTTTRCSTTTSRASSRRSTSRRARRRRSASRRCSAT